MRNYTPVLFLTLVLFSSYELRDKSTIQNFINSDERTLLNLRKNQFKENIKYKIQIKNNIIGLMQEVDFDKSEIQRFIEEVELTTY
jgi:hypothetical protein